MSILENHVWGVSVAQDRVWSHVVGLGPARANERGLMVWQVYADESEGDGIFVLTGLLATAAQWASFSAEWEQLLPKFGILSKEGRYHLHMAEMNYPPERMDRLPPFYKAIEKHVSVGVSIIISKDRLKNGISRIIGFNDHWERIPIIGELVDNIYHFSFSSFLHIFQVQREDLCRRCSIRLDDKIDFIFDDRKEKSKIIGAWESIKAYCGAQERFGRTPQFEDDKDFFPLQAADLIAWWMRKRALETPLESEDGETWKVANYKGWNTQSAFDEVAYVLTEDFIAESIKINIRQTYGDSAKLVDTKYLISVKPDPAL